ncbi:uncharacterized protein LOC134776268 [Penaeus indicus]|uniref:uncharacterized protein LOC134776268 n=1 Tax=Penaeus indicus TaxID=29960 RepID=UPI00300D119C
MAARSVSLSSFWSLAFPVITTHGQVRSKLPAVPSELDLMTFSYYPQYANDASESTLFISHGSVARPWWMVDLEDINLVDRVEVLPRSAYAYRFHQVEVRVGSTPRVGEDFSEWPLLGFYEGPYTAAEGRLTITNETKLCGRYVVVQRVAAQVDLLELADVKVFVHLP